MKQARIGIAALVLAIVVPTQHCSARQGATEKQMAGELASLINAYVELSQWEDPPEPRKNIQTQVDSLLVKMIENESQKVEQPFEYWTATQNVNAVQQNAAKTQIQDLYRAVVPVQNTSTIRAEPSGQVPMQKSLRVVRMNNWP